MGANGMIVICKTIVQHRQLHIFDLFVCVFAMFFFSFDFRHLDYAKWKTKEDKCGKTIKNKR